MDTMDTGHPANPADKVTEGLHVIKTQMPMVYGAIQDKAQEIGKDAFALVRRGLRGEPNTFYAFERGYVVGTPFSTGPITDELAGYLVRFGCAFVCIFKGPDGAAAEQGANDGTA
jgi:hypothetical protein